MFACLEMPRSREVTRPKMARASTLLWIMSGILIPESDGENGLHIRSRSQTSRFHSGSLQPVADMNVGGALRISILDMRDKGVSIFAKTHSRQFKQC